MEPIEEKLKKWLLGVVYGIVSKPDEVSIDARTDEMGMFFVLHVGESDRGKVIGQHGKHAEALRTLLRCAGGLNDVRASMRVEVPGGHYESKS